MTLPLHAVNQLQWRLDNALEIPAEIALGGATKGSVFYRRLRRVINRRRFGVNKRAES
jgi:hypothetical protein